MRWMVFVTIQLSSLGGVASTVIYGPSPWTTATAGGLVWLTHRLFGS
jgi:hypothetical protein